MDDQAIRVLVVDDHKVLRDALSTFFETCDDLVMIGEAGNGQEAIEACTQLQPDVVLMDLLMPVMDGISATRLIHQQYPDIKILVLTSLGDGMQLQEAINAGASGYLLKNTSIEHLADTLRQLPGGKSVQINR